MFRPWSWLFIIVVLSIALACSPQAAPSPSPAPKPAASPSPAPAPTTAPVPKPSPTVAPASLPKSGGTLRFFVQGAPGGFDLHLKPANGPTFLLPVFNNLVRFDPKKPDLVPTNILPDLAERWDVSQDGKTWTFPLRKNVKWHDGKPFTADDVVYTFEKIMDPKRSSLAGVFAVLDKVEKVDDSTVRFTLKRPWPSFLIQLAGGYAPVQAKHKAGTDPRSTDFLVGTGPFKLKNYTSGVAMELVKNQDYFKKDAAGKALPYLDGITMSVMAESAAVDALMTNRLDMGQPGAGVKSSEQFEQIRRAIKDMQVIVTPMPYGRDILLNASYMPILKDVRVRKALALLVDGKSMTLAGSGAEDFAIYGHALFSPSFGLPAAEVNKTLGRDKPWEQRVAEAKKLMAEAGQSEGFKLEMLVANIVDVRQNVVWLADQYRRYLNIDAQVKVVESAEASRLRNSGQFQLAMDSSVANLGDPDELMPLYYTGSPNNKLKYSNPAVDKLWDEQSQTMDLAKRRQLTQEIERIMLADLAVVPTANMNYHIAAWPYVKGFPGMASIMNSNQVFEITWLDR